MKTRLFILIGLMLLYYSPISYNKVFAQEKPNDDNILLITCTSEFYAITKCWVKGFNEQNPNIVAKVVKYEGTNTKDIFTTKADLYIASKSNFTKTNFMELWQLRIGKDEFVPIMNRKNPCLPRIKSHNVSMDILAQIKRPQEARKWFNYPKNGKNKALNYYKVKEPFQNLQISKFLATDQSIEGIEVDNNEKLIAAIQNDPYSIGFCRLSTLICSKSDKNIIIVPVDLNGNKKIDAFENTYSDLQTFLSKGWFRRLPSNLTKAIYSVDLEAPHSQIELAFLKYISTVGQQSTDRFGYTTLAHKEKQSNLKKLGYGSEQVSTSQKKTPFPPLKLYLMVAFILLVIVVGFFLIPNSENNHNKLFPNNNT